MSDFARRERAAKRYARELAREAKEQAKLDESARAQYSVRAFEAQIEVLLSMHKEVGEVWDWEKIAASLPPPPPVDLHRHELRARQDAFGPGQPDTPEHQKAIETARARDAESHRIERQHHEQKQREWEKMSALASRVLLGEPKAYFEALSEFSPLAELVELGTDLDFTIHSKSVVGCVITMKDTSAIPTETKSLTSTGKLSVKATPKARFHEIYQDYICGGMLRVARELFALLPVEHTIITAVTSVFDPSTGNTEDKPVLSALISRDAVRDFQWEKSDPSDAIDRLEHRGDFKASRKSGAFLPIVPLTPAVLSMQGSQATGITEALNEVVALRQKIKVELENLTEV